jgi:hypothetical protein
LNPWSQDEPSKFLDSELELYEEIGSFKQVNLIKKRTICFTQKKGVLGGWVGGCRRSLDQRTPQDPSTSLLPRFKPHAVCCVGTYASFDWPCCGRLLCRRPLRRLTAWCDWRVQVAAAPQHYPDLVQLNTVNSLLGAFVCVGGGGGRLFKGGSDVCLPNPHLPTHTPTHTP